MQGGHGGLYVCEARIYPVDVIRCRASWDMCITFRDERHRIAVPVHAVNGLIHHVRRHIVVDPFAVLLFFFLNVVELVSDVVVTEFEYAGVVK